MFSVNFVITWMVLYNRSLQIGNIYLINQHMEEKVNSLKREKKAQKGKIDLKRLYCYDLRGLYGWESMKSPLNDRRFISRRNFWNEQALSAEVIYNDAGHIQRCTADSKTKHRGIILCNTSNNRGQAQERNHQTYS